MTRSAAGLGIESGSSIDSRFDRTTTKISKFKIDTKCNASQQQRFNTVWNHFGSCLSNCWYYHRRLYGLKCFCFLNVRWCWLLFLVLFSTILISELFPLNKNITKVVFQISKLILELHIQKKSNCK